MISKVHGMRYSESISENLAFVFFNILPSCIYTLGSWVIQTPSSWSTAGITSSSQSNWYGLVV